MSLPPSQSIFVTIPKSLYGILSKVMVWQERQSMRGRFGCFIDSRIANIAVGLCLSCCGTFIGDKTGFRMFSRGASLLIEEGRPLFSFVDRSFKLSYDVAAYCKLNSA